MRLKRVQVREDEYIHVQIPKWYWIPMLIIIGFGMLFLLSGVLVTLSKGLDFFPVNQGESTIFVEAAAVTYFCSLVGSFQLIFALCIFPREIRHKSHPSYRKHWPPWD